MEKPIQTPAPFLKGNTVLYVGDRTEACTSIIDGHFFHLADALTCRGWYQEWGKPAVPMTPGTVIAIPAETKHWHGAARDSWFQHLTYHTSVQEGASNEWLEAVSDEQYENVHRQNP